jgi:PAS domain S-box-containing protein
MSTIQGAVGEDCQRAVLDAADMTSDLACVIDAFGTIRRVNRQWQRVIGLDESAIGGRTVSDVLGSGGDAEDMASFVRRAALEPEPDARIDTRLRAQDGTAVVVQWQAVMPCEHRHVLLVGRDITTERLVAGGNALTVALEDCLEAHPTDLEGVLARFLEVGCRAVGWDAAAVLLTGAAARSTNEEPRADAGDLGSRLVVVSTFVHGEQTPPEALLPLAELAFQAKAATWAGAGPDGRPEPGRHVRMHAVPIAAGEEIVGVLALCCRSPLLPASVVRLDSVGLVAAGIAGRLVRRVATERRSADRRASLEARARAREVQLFDLSRKRHQLDTEVHRSRAEREVAATVGRGFEIGTELDTLVNTSLNLVRAALDADFVGIYEVVDAEERRVVSRYTAGWTPADAGTDGLFEGDRQIVPYAIRAGRAVRTNDLAGEHRFFTDAMRAVGVTEVMCAPLPDRGGRCAIAVCGRTGRGFAPADERFLETVAVSLALAVDRAASARELDEATELERQRIAEGLHDDTIQIVAAIALEVDRCRHRLAGPVTADGTTEVDASLEDIAANLRTVVDQLRSLSFELHPGGLGSFGIAEALRRFAATSPALADLPVTVDERLTRSVDSTASGTIYAIAKEAMINAAKHAGARHVAVELVSNDAGVSLRVADDGRGIDTEGSSESPLHHLGMTTMRLRAERLHGQLTVRSNGEQGTAVEAWFPHPQL